MCKKYKYEEPRKMSAIRQDENLKEIKFSCNTFSILFLEKITTEVRNFSPCNLNVKLPDVCLMLEESKLCII